MPTPKTKTKLTPKQKAALLRLAASYANSQLQENRSAVRAAMLATLKAKRVVRTLRGYTVPTNLGYELAGMDKPVVPATPPVTGKASNVEKELDRLTKERDRLTKIRDSLDIRIKKLYSELNREFVLVLPKQGKQVKANKVYKTAASAVRNLNKIAGSKLYTTSESGLVWLASNKNGEVKWRNQNARELLTGKK